MKDFLEAVTEIDAEIAELEARCAELKKKHDEANELEEARRYGRAYNKTHRQMTALKEERLQMLFPGK